MSTTVDTNVRLSRKRTIRNLSGEIIELLDEANGGYIIRKGQIVNPERWAEICKIEEDKRVAARAIAEQVVSPNAEERKASPSKVDKLEKKVADLDSKLDKILSALNK